ncbi:MAG TPA: hypothetical protein DCE44_11800 [Verrucomicrobiales bacterium]|nr:hypothetical protein [Verrucomicrobiales bacterium]
MRNGKPERETEFPRQPRLSPAAGFRISPKLQSCLELRLTGCAERRSYLRMPAATSLRLPNQRASSSDPTGDYRAASKVDGSSVSGMPRFLTGGSPAPQIQRQVQDAGAPTTSPQDAGPTGTPNPQTPATAPSLASPDPSLPKFDFDVGVFIGPRFDATYMPVGPSPSVGVLNVYHRVFIKFLPFSTRLITDNPRMFGRYRGVRFTAAQRAEFNWTEAQQETFRTDFQRNVHDIWSEQHPLALNESGFAPYRAKVLVNVEISEAAEDAHSTIEAFKMPPGAPRLRSEVRSGRSATLESRDPTEATKHSVFPKDFVRQVGPFEFDSADISPPVEAGSQEVANLIKSKVDVAHDPDAMESVCLDFRGRATPEGSTSYNEELGSRRARTVRNRVNDLVGFHPTVFMEVGTHPGEKNATTDPKFRRVDVTFDRDCRSFEEQEQNVAAHEFGHLLGFGDEYVDERPPSGVLPKFLADRPTHYDTVESEMGSDTANEMLDQESSSIMSLGNVVQRGHYVFFLQAINAMTGKTWTVES